MRERSDILLRQPQGPPPPQAMAPYAPAPLGHPHPAPPAAVPADEQDPQIFAAIFRHWWLIVLFALIGAGVAVLYLRTAQPLYSSWAKLYIAPASGPIAETLGRAERSSFLYTQAEIIRSTPILTKAAETLRNLKTFGGQSGVHYMREELVAEVGRKDDIITVEILSPHPEEAAQIVSAVVRAYTDVSTQQRETESSKLLRALEQQKAKNDADVRAIEAAIHEFRKANPKLAFDAVITGKVQQISQAYVASQLASIDAKAKYAPGHPVVRAALENEQQLYNLYEQALKEHVDVHAKSADQARLQTDLAQKQEFSRRLLDRIKQLEIATSQLPMIADVQVLEPPIVAHSPSWPRKYRTLAVALAAGVMMGAGLALLRDRMDSRMRSVEEIQTIIGLPTLGVVPQMSGRRTAVARAMTVHLDPRSVVAEAYRTIRTALYFGAGSNRCKTILVTSPEPGDGKTTSASNLAIAIAQTGRSVLLLDADFRKPTQHKNLDIKDAVGLSSVLAGRESVGRAIQHTGVEGLDILPCGPIPANPSEILNSREFGELVDKLAERYDHILFDSPPVNAVTDARILGAVCDATILVLRADKSTRKSGEHARNALMSVGARLLGVIVNDAPHRKGYEVYGGSYYGQPDVSVRPSMHETTPPRSSRRRLPEPDEDAAPAASGPDPRRK